MPHLAAPSTLIFDTDPLHNEVDDVPAPPSAKPFYSTSGVVADTTTSVAFERATSWLRNCLDNHQGCAPSNSVEYVPSRLLDVGVSNAEKRDEIRLLEDPPEIAPYAALSYCWGSDLANVLRTLKDNKAAHMRGIAMGSLPKTVQDAVTVCRGLGLRYLWVDALCIVQDDGQDWAREATQMKNVYSGSRVTVAAHAAASCKDGFLGPQRYGQSSWQRAFPTRFGSVGEELQHAFVRIGEAPSSSNDIPPSPLAARGWTLQEALLPHRTLHFTGDEMVWECDAAHFCECGHVTYQPMLRTEISFAHRAKEEAWYQQTLGWMWLIEQYSRRNLTCKSDKLMAIAGLAELVAARNRSDSQPFSMDSVYFSGVFRSTLPAQLLWAVGDPDDVAEGSIQPPCRRRPSSYLAPTWSWASVDGPVSFPVEVWGVDSDSIIKGPAESRSQPAKGSFESLIRFHGSEEVSAASTTTDNSTTGGNLSFRNLRLEGIVVPIVLITLERPFNSSRHGELTDHRKGRSSVVRPRSGKLHEVSCDDIRGLDVRIDDPVAKCLTLEHVVDNAGEDGEPREDGESQGSMSRRSYMDSSFTSDFSDGSEEFGSEGRSSLAGGAREDDYEEDLEGDYEEDCEEKDDGGEEGIGKEEGDDKSNDGRTSWEGSGLENERVNTKGEWCAMCQVGDEYWNEPQFCCLKMARVYGHYTTAVFFLVLRRSSMAPGAWERVGVGRTEVYDDENPAVSLFDGGEARRITLV